MLGNYVCLLEMHLHEVQSVCCAIALSQIDVWMKDEQKVSMFILVHAVDSHDDFHQVQLSLASIIKASFRKLLAVINFLRLL